MVCSYDRSLLTAYGYPAHQEYSRSTAVVVRCPWSLLVETRIGNPTSLISCPTTITGWPRRTESETAPIKMLPLQIVTVAPRCGQIGQRCCESSSMSCRAGVCDGTICVDCGNQNQPACGTNPPFCFSIPTRRLTLVGGVCRACGDEGSPCCLQEPWLASCNSPALKCTAGTCSKPGPVIPAPHQGGPTTALERRAPSVLTEPPFDRC